MKSQIQKDIELTLETTLNDILEEMFSAKKIDKIDKIIDMLEEINKRIDKLLLLRS